MPQPPSLDGGTGRRYADGDFSREGTMSTVEQRWRSSLSRRAALRHLAGFLAASPLALAQQDPFRDHSRVPAMNELLTAFDFEPVAYAKVPRDVYDYTAHGDGSEFTARRNREAFDWVTLAPRGVVNVKSVQTATDILGTKMEFPILLAPTATQQQLHPSGESGVYQGATAAANTPMIVSNNSSLPIGKIAGSGKAPLWYQLYPREEFDQNLQIVEEAQAAGCKAIVATVDQTASYYERAQHNRHLAAPGGRGRGAAVAGGRNAVRQTAPRNPYRVNDGRLWYHWGFIEKLRPTLKVPLLAKGILTAEDAKLCVEHGLDGVVVSNHGGRSMDYGPSTLEVLAEVVDAVEGRIPVLIDGGVRRGTDVLKALALGAKGVCLGRVPRWGLAAYGPAGAQRIIEILQGELLLAMAHTGRASLATVDRSLVRTDFP